MQLQKLHLMIASRNKGKIREISRLLSDVFKAVHSLLSYPELAVPEEIGTTYHDNALQKALWTYSKTKIPCLADDSGGEKYKTTTQNVKCVSSHTTTFVSLSINLLMQVSKSPYL